MMIRPRVAAVLALFPLVHCAVPATNPYDPATDPARRAPVTIKGVAAYPDRQGGGGITVTLTDDRGAATTQTLPDGASGEFSFEVESGTYVVSARAPLYGTVSVGPFSLLPGDLYDLGPLVLSPPTPNSTLRGTVQVNGGVDVSGVVVALYPRSASGTCLPASHQVRASSTGAWELRPVPAGRYVVAAAADGTTWAVSGLIELGNAETRTLDTPLVVGPIGDAVSILSAGRTVAPWASTRELRIRVAQPFFGGMQRVRASTDGTFGSHGTPPAWQDLAAENDATLQDRDGDQVLYVQFQRRIDLADTTTDHCLLTGTYAFPITLDRVPPRVTRLVLHNAGAVVDHDRPDVVATVEADDASGLADVQFLVDGADPLTTSFTVATSPSVPTEFVFRLPTAEGAYDVKVRPRDGAGNVNEDVAAVTVVRDLTDPGQPQVVGIRSDSGRVVVQQGLSARTNDPLPTLLFRAPAVQEPGPLAYVTELSSGTDFSSASVLPAAILTGSTYEVRINIPGGLRDGAYRWRTTAVDGAGRRRASATFTFEVDTQGPPAPPYVRVPSPASFMPRGIAGLAVPIVVEVPPAQGAVKLVIDVKPILRGGFGALTLEEPNDGASLATFELSGPLVPVVPRPADTTGVIGLDGVLDAAGQPEFVPAATFQLDAFGVDDLGQAGDKRTVTFDLDLSAPRPVLLADFPPAYTSTPVVTARLFSGDASDLPHLADPSFAFYETCAERMAVPGVAGSATTPCAPANFAPAPGTDGFLVALVQNQGGSVSNPNTHNRVCVRTVDRAGNRSAPDCRVVVLDQVPPADPVVNATQMTLRGDFGMAWVLPVACPRGGGAAALCDENPGNLEWRMPPEFGPVAVPVNGGGQVGVRLPAVPDQSRTAELAAVDLAGNRSGAVRIGMAHAAGGTVVRIAADSRLHSEEEPRIGLTNGTAFFRTYKVDSPQRGQLAAAPTYASVENLAELALLDPDLVRELDEASDFGKVRAVSAGNGLHVMDVKLTSSIFTLTSMVRIAWPRNTGRFLLPVAYGGRFLLPANSDGAGVCNVDATSVCMVDRSITRLFTTGPQRSEVRSDGRHIVVAALGSRLQHVGGADAGSLVVTGPALVGVKVRTLTDDWYYQGADIEGVTGDVDRVQGVTWVEDSYGNLEPDCLDYPCTANDLPLPDLLPSGGVWVRSPRNVVPYDGDRFVIGLRVPAGASITVPLRTAVQRGDVPYALEGTFYRLLTFEGAETADHLVDEPSDLPAVVPDMSLHALTQYANDGVKLVSFDTGPDGVPGQTVPSPNSRANAAYSQDDRRHRLLEETRTQDVYPLSTAGSRQDRTEPCAVAIAPTVPLQLHEVRIRGKGMLDRLKAALLVKPDGLARGLHETQDLGVFSPTIDFKAPGGLSCGNRVGGCVDATAVPDMPTMLEPGRHYVIMVGAGLAAGSASWSWPAGTQVEFGEPDPRAAELGVSGNANLSLVSQSSSRIVASVEAVDSVSPRCGIDLRFVAQTEYHDLAMTDRTLALVRRQGLTVPPTEAIVAGAREVDGSPVHGSFRVVHTVPQGRKVLALDAEADTLTWVEADPSGDRAQLVRMNPAVGEAAVARDLGAEDAVLVQRAVFAAGRLALLARGAAGPELAVYRAGAEPALLSRTALTTLPQALAMDESGVAYWHVPQGTGGELVHRSLLPLQVLHAGGAQRSVALLPATDGQSVLISLVPSVGEWDGVVVQVATDGTTSRERARGGARLHLAHAGGRLFMLRLDQASAALQVAPGDVSVVVTAPDPAGVEQDTTMANITAFVGAAPAATPLEWASRPVVVGEGNTLAVLAPRADGTSTLRVYDGRGAPDDGPEFEQAGLPGVVALFAGTDVVVSTSSVEAARVLVRDSAATWRQATVPAGLRVLGAVQDGALAVRSRPVSVAQYPAPLDDVVLLRPAPGGTLLEEPAGTLPARSADHRYLAMTRRGPAIYLHDADASPDAVWRVALTAAPQVVAAQFRPMSSPDAGLVWSSRAALGPSGMALARTGLSGVLVGYVSYP